jgi:potassium efflux system protein
MLVCLWLRGGAGAVQTALAASPATQSAAPVQALEKTVHPDTLAGQEADVQARLQALAQSDLPPEALEALRATLEQQLKVLTALRDTLGKRGNYLVQLERLPQRVDELHAERQTLEAQPPRSFSAVTEELRNQYEAQLQAIQSDIAALSKQQAVEELRLAGIARELDQLGQERMQLETELLTARSEATNAPEQKLLLSARVELLELRWQSLRAQTEALLAEREWLTKRGPLQDALLSLAQTRLQGLQQDLETIAQALTQELSREQAALTTTAHGIEHQLVYTADPLEAFLLTLELETVEIRKVTANYRQQLNHISEQVLAQEKLNSQEKQDLERLASLIERYASGERVAQRLQVAFARLRRELARHPNEAVKLLERQLQALTEQAIELDDKLYEFERQTETRVKSLMAKLAAVDPVQREATIARIRQELDTQKAGLREQQQTLAELGQDLTKLISLHRERKQLLDESYRFILTKMFWLRDGQTMSWAVVQDAVSGAGVTARRLQAFVQAELTSLLTDLLQSLRFWLLMPVVFLLLPWAAVWARRRLHTQARAYIVQGVRGQTLGHKIAAAVLTLFQTTIWPTYIAVVVWGWTQFLPAGAGQSELQVALVGSVQFGALLLWIGLLGHAIFRRDGWGQQYVGLNADLCRFLRWTVAAGWLAALLLLVPRHFLLVAAAEPEATAGSLALARLCLTAFHSVLLVLVAVVGRRGSCVMQTVLDASRQRHGVLWRHWPLVYLVMLAGMATIIALDLQGFRYAAKELWLRSAESLVVIVTLMTVYRVVSAIIDRLARQRRRAEDRPVDPGQPSRWSLLQQGRQFVRLTFILIGLVVIQRLYGLDQDLFRALDAFHVVAVGKWETGEPLWLTLADILTALLIFTGLTLIVRNLPGLYEVALFPRVQWDAGFRYAFVTLSRYLLVLLGLWWGLAVLHLRWSSIQWIIAAASVGLGFGLQEIVSNFVSGLILLVERPISVGDYVTVGGQEGTVTRITIRATTIQNLDNQTVIIPNKEFIAGQVTNWTLGDTHVRTIVRVGVAYGSDLELVRRLLLEVVTNHPQILRYPVPEVLFSAFSESSLDWEVRFMVPNPRDRFRVINDVLLQIERAFREQSVEIPFPQRDLHLRSADVALELRPAGNGYPAAPDTAPLRPTATSPPPLTYSDHTETL